MTAAELLLSILTPGYAATLSTTEPADAGVVWNNGLVVCVSAGFTPAGLFNDGGVLMLLLALTGYPTSTAGLPAGAIWSNGNVVSVVAGVVPDPTALAIFYGSVTANALLALGGGNLPLTGPTVGSGQLWNSGGEVWVA